MQSNHEMQIASAAKAQPFLTAFANNLTNQNATENATLINLYDWMRNNFCQQESTPTAGYIQFIYIK